MTSVVAAASGPEGVASHFRRMTWAGVALGLLPPGLWVALFLGYRLSSGEVLAAAGQERSVASSAAMAVVSVVLLAAAVLLGRGVVSALTLHRRVLPSRQFVVAWLVCVALSVGALCLPPFWAFGTPWMFISVTLAARPLWWRRVVPGPASPRDASAHVAQAMWLAVLVTSLAHAMAWLTVIAVGMPARPEDLAPSASVVESLAVAPPPVAREDRGLDLIELTTGSGLVAAGRYVGGDMSLTQFSIGIWPALARIAVTPSTVRPTVAQSWAIAAAAFVLSVAFWTPWVMAWTWLGTRDARRIAEHG